MMQCFFEPRSVVLIGVSRQSGSGAYNNLEVMLSYGYRANVYVVHPKAAEILGHKTYPRVEDLPEVPELAIISVGRDRVLPVFEECARKGIGHVIVISQGFADADMRGAELQEVLLRTAREYGVRVVGPNTMGVLNAFVDFSTAFVDIQKDCLPPPMAIVAQSGVFQVGYECFTGRVGKAIDVGNCADVDFVDALEYLEKDPQTRLIVLHMEGMKRGRTFLRTAARIARTKPIIILKTGRSDAGAKAALSHTGSLVGEDAIFDAAFARAGLIRVRNMIEMLAVSKAFLHFDSLAGPRLGVVTATGACGIMTADACEDYGLALAPFPEKIRSGLELPHISWHRLQNPVDLWPLGMVGGSFTDVFKRAAKGLLEDETVDAVLAIAPAMPSPLHRDLDMAAAIRELRTSTASPKPIALWLYGGDQARQGAELDDAPNVASFATIDEAVMGFAALWRYRQFQARGSEEADQALQPAAPSPSPAMPLSPGNLLVGDAAFALLKGYGIPTAPGKLTRNTEAALTFAREVGYPVVLKVISPEWLHKSDQGGIRLGIASPADLRRAYAELGELFHSRTPSGTLEGILVQKQVRGVELLMGVKKDPQFGPVLVAGMGGIYTEIFKDVSRALAPVSSLEAEHMLEALRIFPILQGVRGQKGVHLQSLVDALGALSRLAMDYPEVAELDLNPVMADAEGCWCVDCRIVVEQVTGV